jgi:hypothetical protein
MSQLLLHTLQHPPQGATATPAAPATVTLSSDTRSSDTRSSMESTDPTQSSGTRFSSFISKCSRSRVPLGKCPSSSGSSDHTVHKKLAFSEDRGAYRKVYPYSSTVSKPPSSFEYNSSTISEAVSHTPSVADVGIHPSSLCAHPNMDLIMQMLQLVGAQQPPTTQAYTFKVSALPRH